MTNILKLALVGISLLSLSACKTNVSTDLYSSDLFASENLKTPAKMELEITSCTSEKRPEYERSILALFDQNSEAKIIGCSRDGMNSMLEVGFQAEIATQESNADLTLFRQNVEDETRIGVGIKPVFGIGFVQRVETLMKEKMQRFDYDDLKFEVVLNNDERNVIDVTGYNIWVNSEPFEQYRRQPLERREKIRITLPDIASDLILRGKQPIIFWVSFSK